MIYLRYTAVVLIVTLATLVQLQAGENEDNGLLEIRIPTTPVIKLHYGLSSLSLDEFDRPFGDPGALHLRLGFMHLSGFNDERSILDHMSRFVSIAYYSTEINDGANSGELGSSLWRFGLIAEDGYGYRLSGTSDGLHLLLNNSSGMTWSDISLDRPEVILEDNRTERFEDAIRFGSLTEAGIQLQLGETFGMNASFERSIIYERQLFWKWTGSVLIEGALHGLTSIFVDAIMESSPAAGPIVNFVLQNGLAYGIYELRKSNMNWPFETAAPLHYDTFKLGLTFTF